MSNCKVTLGSRPKNVGNHFQVEVRAKHKNVDIKQKIFLLCQIVKVTLFWDQDQKMLKEGTIFKF